MQFPVRGNPDLRRYLHSNFRAGRIWRFRKFSRPDTDTDDAWSRRKFSNRRAVCNEICVPQHYACVSSHPHYFPVHAGNNRCGYAPLDRDPIHDFVGLGIGVSFVIFNIATLHGISPQYKGAATSLVVFFRTIGSALGVTIFGVIQTTRLKDNIAAVLPDPAQAEKFGDPQALLNPAVRQMFPAEILQRMIAGLADSIAFLFEWSVALPVVAVIFILMLGRARVPKGAQTEAPRSFE